MALDILLREIEVGDIVFYRVKGYGSDIKSFFILVSSTKEDSFRGHKVYTSQRSNPQVSSSDAIFRSHHAGLIYNELWNLNTPFKEAFEDATKILGIIPNKNTIKESVAEILIEHLDNLNDQEKIII